MKKLLLIALALTGFMAKAQYFQHTYGNQSPEIISSGINIIAPAPLGHFIAGWGKSPCLPPLSTITAAYTDPLGNVGGAPYFEKTYMLMTAAGQSLHVRDAKALQLPAAVGVGLFGMYIDFSLPSPNNTGIYFMQIAPGGLPTAVFNYSPVPGFQVVEVGGVSPTVTAPGDVYVTGTVADAFGVAYPFAMRVNMVTGVPVWTQIYNITAPATSAWGMDIAENPSLPPTPFPFQGAAIAGYFFNGGTTDAYMFHIDATTGAVAPAPAFVMGTPASNERFNSINQALPSPAFPIPGFVLGGTTDLPGNLDFLFLRMDFLLGPFLFNSYDYGMLPGTDNECFDVIQRFNVAGQDEYYLCGRTTPGFFGNSDVLVTKIDQFGVPVPGGEFTYGTPNMDAGHMLDQNNIGAPGPPGGLSVYAMTDVSGVGTNADLYTIKAYFNGLSGCNEAFNTSITIPFPPPAPMMPVVTVGNINPMPNLIVGYFDVFDNTLCFNPVIGGGSNAFVAPPDDGKNSKAMLLMPNPAEAASRVTLQIESEVVGSADVEVYDMLGKLYYSQKHVLKKGKNNLPIDISSAGMAAGIYNVKIHGAKENQTIQLLVK